MPAYRTTLSTVAFTLLISAAGTASEANFDREIAASKTESFIGSGAELSEFDLRLAARDKKTIVTSIGPLRIGDEHRQWRIGRDL
jgi:hypothetical protein